jgi:GGDEF domain-containing protein
MNRGTAPQPSLPAADELLVDPLTGLGTRQALLGELEGAVHGGSVPALLVIFSLDGFEEYVTLYGSLAARTLVVKLAARLAEALGPEARCYRPRQDELAALVPTRIDGVREILDAAVLALRERAPSVTVSAAWGAAMLPEEASDPVEALRVADTRLASNAPRRRRRSRRSNPERR